MGNSSGSWVGWIFAILIFCVITFFVTRAIYNEEVIPPEVHQMNEIRRSAPKGWIFIDGQAYAVKLVDFEEGCIVCHSRDRDSELVEKYLSSRYTKDIKCPTWRKEATTVPSVIVPAGDK